MIKDEETVSPASEIWRKVFSKKKEVVSRNIAGETILVPVTGKLADMQKIFSLNPAAEYIWGRLDGERDLEEIRDGVLSLFEVEKEQAESDIREFILQLLKEDLISETK